MEGHAVTGLSQGCTARCHFCKTLAQQQQNLVMSENSSAQQQFCTRRLHNSDLNLPASNLDTLQCVFGACTAQKQPPDLYQYREVALSHALSFAGIIKAITKPCASAQAHASKHGSRQEPWMPGDA
eukprot:1142191-Pelagomonas_calceolata.AAC.2